MRDILILTIVLIGCIAALRKPWIGVMLWTWLSIMNPHRYTFGFSYDFPLAALAAISTLIGLLSSSEKDSPFKGAPTIWLIIFMLWFTLSWLTGLDVSGDYPQWTKVMKIDFMLLVALVLLRNKMHIFALSWTVAGSIALLGAKGGLFTILNGGNYRVWGPPGSFIEDNNEFALAVIITIPLLRFLQLQLASVSGKHAMTGIMLLCTASALGSHSRGALLAISAMAILLWWRSKNKIGTGLIMVFVAIVASMFMPESWFSRMETISNFEQDRSAMGRISAWWTAWNIAWFYPTGVGFNPATPAIFAIFSPYPDFVHAAHSIYFQILGNHGFVGLFIFLMIWATTWHTAAWLRKHSPPLAAAEWCRDLGGMVQVALAGYLVGGAFLSLAYFDLPYNLMVLVVLARVWVTTKSWESEPTYSPGWKTIPGLVTINVTKK